MADARRKWKPGELAGALQVRCNLRVVVVGEAILDEYVFCSTLGQSNEAGPTLSGGFRRRSVFWAERWPWPTTCRPSAARCSCWPWWETKRTLSRRHPGAMHPRPEVQLHFVIHRGLKPTTVKRSFREA